MEALGEICEARLGAIVVGLGVSGGGLVMVSEVGKVREGR